MGGLTPFVISYFTHDIAANRRLYGGLLGLELHTEPVLEETFFLAGSEDVRLQFLNPPGAPGLAGTSPSPGLVLIGVTNDDDLEALLNRASAVASKP